MENLPSNKNKSEIVLRVAPETQESFTLVLPIVGLSGLRVSTWLRIVAFNEPVVPSPVLFLWVLVTFMRSRGPDRKTFHFHTNRAGERMERVGGIPCLGSDGAIAWLRAQLERST